MKNAILKISILTLVLIATFIILPQDAISQCPMCRMAAESNLENGGSEGAGLNTGILYMLSLPYLLVAIIGFLWYRNRKMDNLSSGNSEI